MRWRLTRSVAISSLTSSAPQRYVTLASVSGTHAAWRRTQPSGSDVDGAVHPSLDSVRPDLDLNAGCLGVQPTCRVASRPAHDHRAELVARDRELGHRDHVAVGKALESGVSDEQLRSPIELVGHPTLAELDLAVHAAVGGVGIDLDHDSILQVDWSLPPEESGPEHRSGAR